MLRADFEVGQENNAFVVSDVENEENVAAAAVDIDENKDNIAAAAAAVVFVVFVVAAAAAAVAVAAGSVTVTIGFLDVAVLGFVAMAAVVDNNKKYIKNVFPFVFFKNRLGRPTPS